MSKKQEKMKALIKEVLEDLLDEEESDINDQEVQLPEEVTQTIEEEQTTVQEVVTEATEEDIVDNSDLTSKIEELEKELETQKAQNKQWAEKFNQRTITEDEKKTKVSDWRKI